MIEVVIPAHNAEKFIHATLASVAAQLRAPDLVSVVNDRSTDATAAITAAAARAFAPRIRIQLLRNEGPRGPSAARNTAIRQSKADYIALLDADDLMLPNHLTILASALDAAEVVLSFADTEVFAAEHVPIPSLLHESNVAHLPAMEGPAGYWRLRDGILGPAMRCSVFGTSACLIRRSALLRAGLFDESMMFAEDMDLFLRLALEGPFVFSRSIVCRKRVHGANLSHDRNHLAFCHGTCQALIKLTDPSQLARLTRAQRSELGTSLRTALNGYLYHASRASIAAYRRAATLAGQAGFGGLALHPRHLLRLALPRSG